MSRVSQLKIAFKNDQYLIYKVLVLLLVNLFYYYDFVWSAFNFSMPGQSDPMRFREEIILWLGYVVLMYVLYRFCLSKHQIIGAFLIILFPVVWVALYGTLDVIFGHIINHIAFYYL